MSRLVSVLVLLSLAVCSAPLGLSVSTPSVPGPCVRDRDCDPGSVCRVPGFGLCSSTRRDPDGRSSLLTEDPEDSVSSTADYHSKYDDDIEPSATDVVTTASDDPNANNLKTNRHATVTGDVPAPGNASAKSDVTTSDNVTTPADVSIADAAAVRRLRLTLPPLSPCLRHRQCSSGHCSKLGVGVCVSDRRCRHCSDLQYCSNSACRDRRASGEACRRDGQCLSDVCLPAEAGAREGVCGCDADDDCAQSEFCDTDGACQTKRANQQPCEEDGQCVSSTCVGGLCGCDADTHWAASDGSCRLKKRYPASCGAPDECVSDLCIMELAGLQCGCEMGSEDCGMYVCLPDGSCD